MIRHLEINTKLNNDPRVKKVFAKIHANNSKRNFAKWEHIKTAYDIDVYGPDQNEKFTKLTEEHITANKLKKMSVHHATQILSETVGNEIGLSK